MAAEAVDLQVDEAGGQQLAGLQLDHLVRARQGPVHASDPGDHRTVDQDAVGFSGDAVHAATEECPHRARLSPSAAARSPPTDSRRARASSAVKPERSMRMATDALPPDSASARSASTFPAPVRSATRATARP